VARAAQTKAERREARANQPTKAERREARTEHKRQAANGAPPPPVPSGEVAGHATLDDGVDECLHRIEETLAGQTARDQELLSRAMLAKEAIQAAVSPPEAEAGGTLDREMDAGIKQALRLRRENVVAVDQPLALICQAQRSGGTLLARLFDGHPQCHAHPHELHIGDNRPHIWPTLALDESPKGWYAKLQEEKLGDLFDKGKSSIPLKAAIEDPARSFYPFILPPAFQRRLFLDEVERRSPIGSEREILDCYMTSLFNGWLDNQNLHGPPKRWVVAFSPRRAWGEGLGKLFELYPDGRLISILRDPLSWYSSAQGRDPEADPDKLLEHWRRSARELLEADRRYGDRLCVVRFDELVLETAATMRRLAGFLDIDFHPRLTSPTFNGYPVGANSSYEVRSTGVVTDPVERYKELLSPEQQKNVSDQCEELYLEALALARGDRAPDTTRVEPISLHTATIGQLVGIEGIGRVTARQIVEFRDRRGGVSSIEELVEVSGIGPRTMEALRGRLEP
jgi:competence ComEA-like helix-hairpin-helix protein